ncbi:MAG: alpha-D-ribose 1-methylphosphonate 5-triphosphate diphosphatase [Pseudomonadota bacterium]
MLRALPPTLSATALASLDRLGAFDVRPGIVDLHGDGFERHLAPRRGALKDLTQGLVALDAELAANGITTAVLAQFWSWEGGMRGPDFARRLVAALATARPQLLTDMRVQLRVEISMIDDFDDIARFVGEAGITDVVFNDHLPHDALAKGRTPPRLQGQALKAGRAPKDHEALLRRLHDNAPAMPGAVAALAQRLRAAGVRLGSHDDATADSRARFRQLGATLAEFPETQEALNAAHAAGDTIVLGAPNVVRGGSHKKNLSAADAVRAGRCDVLVSDYHYPAPRQAALLLERDGIDAWPLISAAPARALGLTDRGTLDLGQRTDLCVLDSRGRVVGTMVAGRWSYLTAPLIEALA